MKATTLYVVVAALLLCICLHPVVGSRMRKIQRAQPNREHLRLIETSEGTKWMTEEEIVKLRTESPTHGGFFDITDHRELGAANTIQFDPIPTRPARQDIVGRLLNILDPSRIELFNHKLTAFFNRYYTTETGAQAALLIKSQMEAIAEGRNDISVRLFEHSWRQPSVIARIEGNGPNKDQVVILGAHEDSIAGGANSQAPGADDDGSGTATVVEIFRVLAQSGFRPNRTIEIHTYAAEEVGLRGSQDVAAAYKHENVNVYAMMQFDMTLYPGKPGYLGVITDFTDPQLTQFLRNIVDAYCNIKWEDSRCGYGCSDHASWTKAGYRSAFPFEAPFSKSNPYIHSKNDIFAHLDLEHGTEFAKLGIAYAVELSLAD